MKRFTLLFALLFSLRLGAETTLSTSQAAQHVGETSTVCGKVLDVHTAYRSHGQPTFIDIDGVYPRSPFTVLVWGDDRPKFPNLAMLTESYVCVHGRITAYRGSPEMIVSDPADLKKR